MGKRSNFERNPRDYYPTPEHAVLPLLPHFKKKVTFAEPCAGDGRLINHLEKHGHTCTAAFDIEPQTNNIQTGDALAWQPTTQFDCIITNPPWDRKILHPMIEHFRQIAPTMLLFDADWMHTKQATEFLPYCHKIISIGRVKWFNDKGGLDNSCWYLFDKTAAPTIFHERTI